MMNIKKYEVGLVRESETSYPVNEKVSSPKKFQEVVNSVFNIQESCEELFIIACVDTKNQIIIEYNVIEQFGSGGNVEVICPFCQDTINFEYFNLDERKNKATRICSCEAITRISVLGFNKNIFLSKTCANAISINEFPPT